MEETLKHIEESFQKDLQGLKKLVPALKQVRGKARMGFAKRRQLISSGAALRGNPKVLKPRLRFPLPATQAPLLFHFSSLSL